MADPNIRPVVRVDLAIMLNTWFDDGFQFGDPADFTWNFNNVSFTMSIKQGSFNNPVINNNPVLLTLTSGNGQIVVQDTVNRILNFNVPDATMRNALTPGVDYVYDLLMTQNSTGQVDALMTGEIECFQGVTIPST